MKPVLAHGVAQCSERCVLGYYQPTTAPMWGNTQPPGDHVATNDESVEDQSSSATSSYGGSLPAWPRAAVLAGFSLTFLVFATQPAAAQVGPAFCESDMATTIKNLFTLIQFGGPLVGGVIALGAIVATPTVRRADLKREIKEIRNQAIIWGIIVAPLGTAIVAFILNNVVAGGSSCGF